MNVIKSLTENIDKICKYIPFAIILLCISISSFIIHFCDISSSYLIVAIYSGSLFIGTITRGIVSIMQNKYIRKKFTDSKWLSKVWDSLSKEEQTRLKEMYSSDESILLNVCSRVTLTLQSRGIIHSVPNQIAYNNTMYYVLEPWALKMIENNEVKL